MIQVKLEPPLGDSIEAARGKRAENWRSHMALPSVAANLETARDLYATAGGFGDLYRALGGDPAVDQQVRAGFDEALRRREASRCLGRGGRGSCGAAPRSWR